MKKKKALSNSRWDGHLEDHVSYSMAEDIAREIDRSIIWSTLEINGWVQVHLERFWNNHHAVDMQDWIENNCQGKYFSSSTNFIFEDAKDATMFILRWS